MKDRLGFFDLEDRYAQLSTAGDRLEKLAGTVDFEPFRYRLIKALKRSDGSKGGPGPYDPVLTFKILILRALYGLSDEQTEFMIRDRLSFMRFPGLGPGDAVPDATTIWLLREQLGRAGAVGKLFARFDRLLAEKGYLAMSGQILDASLVPAPRRRLDEGGNQAIKEGQPGRRDLAGGTGQGGPEGHRRPLDAEAEQGQARHREGRQPAAEIAIPVFGYKNHIGIDRRFGLIRTGMVTDAAAHDGARLREGPVDRDNTASDVWADSADRSGATEAYLAGIGKTSRIHARKPRGKPMPRPVARANAVKSAIRSFVEHVFADQKARMGLAIRTIGPARAHTKIGLANLAYNMRRLLWLDTRTAPG